MLTPSKDRLVPLVPSANENVVPLEKSDDLCSKYAIATEYVSCPKKRNKKVKVRTLDIEFPVHGNGLAPQTNDSHTSHDVSGRKIINGYFDEFPAFTKEEMLEKILPVMKNVFREFLLNMGNSPSDEDQLKNFIALSEISPSDREILKTIINEGHLPQLLESSELFNTSFRNGKLVLYKREDNAISKTKPNICQNFISSLDMNEKNASEIREEGTLASPLMKTFSQNAFMPNGEQTDPRPPSGELSRPGLGISAWEYSQIVRDLRSDKARLGNELEELRKALANKDLVINCLQKQVDERDGEIARLKERLRITDDEIKERCEASSIREEKLIAAEVESRKKIEHLLRELERLRCGVDRERERELTELRVKISASKGTIAFERGRLKKAHKELLELRLGKAKALATKRISQANFAIAHIPMILNSCSDIDLKLCMQDVRSRWNEILNGYKAWLSDLDIIAEAQKVLLDADTEFDDLPLFTPPNHIPSAPNLPARALALLNRFTTAECDSCTAVIAASSNIPTAPPPGFEMVDASRGCMFGAIGQPTVSSTHSSSFLSDAEVRKLIEKTNAYFRSPGKNHAFITEEEIRKCIKEVERMSSSLKDECRKPPSILKYIIQRLSVIHNIGCAARNAPWAQAPNTGDNPRTVNADCHICKICLNPTSRKEQLLECPNNSCAEPYHSECVTSWLKENSTCPNCRGLWNNPREYPSLSSALT